MAYRADVDLEFFKYLSSKDLNDLVECLTKDKDGDKLWTEELTSHKLYKNHFPAHIHYWELIAAEIQCFGANSITTFLRRGKGVPYREILCDACNKLKVRVDKKDDILEIENKLLVKILDGIVQKMTDDERLEFSKIIGASSFKSLTPTAITAAIQMAFQAGGFKSFQLTLMIANTVSRAILGRGLAFAGKAAWLRGASMFTGPVGWTVTGAWTVIEIAGPAYRVTIPAVIQVALLRKKYQAERDGILKDIEEELSKL